MDYRHYRGDPLKIPQWLESHLHILKYLGIVLALTPIVIGWLAVLQIIPRYSWWYLVAHINYPLGLTLFIIGYSFSTTADRRK
jgi:hypothetical protein